MNEIPSFQPLRVIGHGAFGKLLKSNSIVSYLFNICIGYVFEAYDNNRMCKVALKRT